MNLRSSFALTAFAALTFSASAAEPAASASTVAKEKTADPRPRSDAAGNPIRYTPTGHVSNYDESKVGAYTLPDPLVMKNGRPVRDADAWRNQRRPEILKLYESEIFGRVPPRAPKMSFAVVSSEPALEGMAVRRHIVGKIGHAVDAPKVNVILHLPANAKGPVPVLLNVSFFGAGGLTPPPTITPAPSSAGTGGAAQSAASATAPASANNVTPAIAAKKAAPRDTTPVGDMLARGYGYATFRYTEFEGDRADGSVNLVRKLALAPGQDKPAADEWGTIAAWAWGASRVLDYFETDRAIDAKRVAVIGHSRLGKTVLWAGASDPRFALVFSSCSGEMGAALARRDWGESVDDMAANFPWQFAGNFQKYAGKWNDMPVDAHLLIALNAPRPVFITGGTADQWADPKGEFLAAVAAAPVYRLLGKTDLGTSELPPLDHPLTSGTLGFHYHTGGHTITASDWTAFLEFADRHLKPNL
jgi:hypothetical protein